MFQRFFCLILISRALLPTHYIKNVHVYKSFTGADPGILIRGGVTLVEHIGVLRGQSGIAPLPHSPKPKKIF